MMNGNIEGPQIPEQTVQLDQQVVQKNIEAQMGNLLVQICIKNAVIEQLQGELNSLKMGVIQPARPVSGQPLERK